MFIGACLLFFDICSKQGKPNVSTSLFTDIRYYYTQYSERSYQTFNCVCASSGNNFILFRMFLTFHSKACFWKYNINYCNYYIFFIDHSNHFSLIFSISFQSTDLFCNKCTRKKITTKLSKKFFVRIAYIPYSISL